ncbi:hypothetical protein DL768_005612 [Monosporascus sp. mg162]|nr:hypothetical protein DL768_005612 [Monosporascus sp. mg162]
MRSPVERYAALSYVWGGNLTLALLTSNYAELSDAGFSSYMERMPRMIIDAFRVVRELGIRYIWVDSLCIIQDDTVDMRDEVRQMDAVYRNAALTVCVASGGSARHGIPGIKDTLRTEEENCSTLSSFRVRTLAPVAEMIHASLWDTRAWTFQERLLSRRCAIFTPNEIVWQCRAATWRESVEYPLDASLWNLDSIGTPFRDMNENPVRRYSSEVVEAELDVTEEAKTSLEWLRSPPARLAPRTEGLLGFRTFTGMFSLSRKSMSSSAFSNLSPGLRRFGIIDRAGDWCGTIVLDELKWLSQVGALFEFAAISCAKDFAMDELDTWTYYIPQEREHADWYCFFAIMLKPMPGSPGIFERAGLAKIYGSAFALGSFPNAGWKEIVLC